MFEQERKRSNLGKAIKEPDKRTSIQRKPILFIVVSIVVSVLATVFVLFYLLLWYIPYDAAEIAQVKEKAIQKWNAADAIPVQDNGWYQYWDAINLYGTSLTDQESERIHKITVSGVKPDNLVFMTKMKKKTEKALALVEEGYNKPEFHIPLDYSRGDLSAESWIYLFSENFPEYLMLMGDYEKLNGNNSEAARRYLQLLYMKVGSYRIGDTYRFYSAVDSEKNCLVRIRELLNSTEDEDQCYKSVSEEMVRIDKKRAAPKDLIEFQLAINEVFIEKITQGGSNSDYLDRNYPGIPQGFRKIAGLRDRKATVAYLYKILIAPQGTFKETCDSINRESVPWFYTDYGVHLKDQTVLMIGKYNYNKAMHGGVEILAALKWYRKERGEYPDTLAVLTPVYLTTLPKDPFADDGNFRYIKGRDSILLYSVGPDLKDDKGQLISEECSHPGDIVFSGGKPVTAPEEKP